MGTRSPIPGLPAAPSPPSAAPTTNRAANTPRAKCSWSLTAIHGGKKGFPPGKDENRMQRRGNKIFGKACEPFFYLPLNLNPI